MDEIRYTPEVWVIGKQIMPIRKKDMYEIIKIYERFLGNGFEVGPLKRTEGGIIITKTPGMNKLSKEEKPEIVCKIITGNHNIGDVRVNDDWNETWKDDETIMYPLINGKKNKFQISNITLVFQSFDKNGYNGASNWDRLWAEKLVRSMRIWGFEMKNLKPGNFKICKKYIPQKKL